MNLGLVAIADTSGLLAALNKSQPEHVAAARAAEACGVIIVSPFALTEMHYLAGVRAGSRTADALLRRILDRVESRRAIIAPTTAKQLNAALQVRTQYTGLDLDLTDAVNVVLAAEFRTECILTLDRRDFRAISPLTEHSAFRLLPDDL